MKVFELNHDAVRDHSYALQHYSILPTDSAVLVNFPENQTKLNQITDTNFRYVFVDCSYDPIWLSDDSIQELMLLIQQHFTKSKCIFLSSRCQDYYTTYNNVLWYPYFLLRTYVDESLPIRSKRIGCLNRRNAAHRVWLMHNLISQGLIDHERDIFSILFNNLYDNQPCKISNWINVTLEDRIAIQSYPDSIATVPDGFGNDHTTAHPAWSTAVTVVSETEVGGNALITEKTAKALVANCCWILHTGQAQLEVMQDLGFDLSLFEQHAIGQDITPILDVCQQLDTESAALDYYYSQQSKIVHNREWYTNGWLNRYLEKFHQIIS